jgi:hypothetical protein
MSVMRRKIIGTALIAIPVILVLAVLWVVHVASVAPVTHVAAVIPETPARPVQPAYDNPANRQLADLTSTEQAAVLGKKIGHGCDGIVAFPMGFGSHDADRGDAYWSVRCADGASYAVVLHPDKAGTASVLSCDAMRQAGRECFKPLPQN